MIEAVNNKELIDKLESEHRLEMQEWITLLGTYTDEDRAYAADRARRVADRIYGKSIFIRGIVEFSNICKNNCYYCGFLSAAEPVINTASEPLYCRAARLLLTAVKISAE